MLIASPPSKWLSLDPLVLNSSLTDTVLSTGLSASFTCTARGVPRPSIKWLIGGASPPKMNPRFSIQEQVSFYINKGRMASLYNIKYGGNV